MLDIGLSLGLSNDPYDLLAYGWAINRLGHKKEEDISLQILIFKKVLETDPTLVWAHFGKADVYYCLQKYKEAL